MKKTTLLIIIFFSASSFGTTGNELFKHCAEGEKSALKEDYNLYEALQCSAYIKGVLDTEYVFVLSFDEIKQASCLPESVTNGQITSIVYKYLSDNPSTRHKNASVLVMEALIESFPCKTPKKK